jgi:protein-tyrosine phosphatase
MTTTTWLALGGVSNARDIGGLRTSDGKHRVRYGVVYRSGELSACDAAAWTELVDRRGVRHLCDLRRADERELYPVTPPPGVHVHAWDFAAHLEADVQARVAHIRAALEPLNAAPDADLTAFVAAQHAHYADLPSVMRAHLRGVFDVVLGLADDAAAAAAAVVVYCQAGKDRTGFAIAFLLAAVGVEQEAILDDYELTTYAYEHAPPPHEHLRKLLMASGLDGLSPRVLRAMSIAYRPMMKHALDSYAAAHGGSLAKYVQANLGVTDAEIAKLRTILLEPI